MDLFNITVKYDQFIYSINISLISFDFIYFFLFLHFLRLPHHLSFLHALKTCSLGHPFVFFHNTTRHHHMNFDAICSSNSSYLSHHILYHNFYIVYSLDLVCLFYFSILLFFISFYLFLASN